VVGLATVLGAGGGTSSYKEIEETDVILLLWGSNAREAHPIFFHHLMKGLNNGARMYSIDPRRTSSAKFADVWMGLNLGSDVALANTIGREIIAADLHNKDFIAHSSQGFEDYKASVESYTLEFGEQECGIPAEAIRELAHDYAKADKAQILWTLGITEHHNAVDNVLSLCGITEHHNAVDNVLSLCNLALLTGHIGRWGSGLVPLRGQNNVQGGGDMGALPNKLPGFQNIDDPAARGKFEAVYGKELNPTPGLHLTLMFEAMGRGDLKAVYVIGENPADSEADINHARKMLEGLDLLVVQDIFLTRTAEMADVVLPASVAWAESNGTVTSSERRVQRVRAAVPPPGEARDDIEIIYDIARRMGTDWGTVDPEQLWDELRSLSPLHKGMSLGRRPRRSRSGAIQPGRARWPEGRTERRVPAASHDRPRPRLVQHGRAERGVRLADSLRRRARPQPRRRRGNGHRRWRTRSCQLGSRFGRDGRPVSARSPERTRVHDVPLPGTRRLQCAHQRRLGQALGNG